MSLVRDLPFTVVGLEDHILVSCSDIMSTAGSTSAVGIRGTKTTVSAIITTGDIGYITTGSGTKLVSSGGIAVVTTQCFIWNRLRYPLVGAKYEAVGVSAHLISTRGSTEAGRKLAIGVKLQHGDSSAGGDMADYSTANQPDDKVYFSSVRTCDMLNWDFSDESTGPVHLSQSGLYDLRAAKQYIRLGVRVGKELVTTESSGDEQARVSGYMTFLAADALPQV